MFKENNLKLMNQDITIYIEGHVLKEFSSYQAQDCFEREAGGIIIGYFDVQENAIRITDITWPQEKDICGRSRFIRKEKGHQELMDEIWTQSGYTKSYLGEWHTHNQCTPIPSSLDQSNWIGISKRMHNFSAKLFIIVGRMYSGMWMVDNCKIQKIGEWEKVESII